METNSLKAAQPHKMNAQRIPQKPGNPPDKPATLEDIQKIIQESNKTMLYDIRRDYDVQISRLSEGLADD